MPNTDAEKQTTGETEAPGGESALQDKKDQVTGSDTDQKQQQSSANKGVKRELFKLREQKRHKTLEMQANRTTRMATKQKLTSKPNWID